MTTTSEHGTDTRPSWAARRDIPARYVATLPRPLAEAFEHQDTVTERIARAEARLEELAGPALRQAEADDAQVIRAAVENGSAVTDPGSHVIAVERETTGLRSVLDQLQADLAEAEAATLAAARTWWRATDAEVWPEFQAAQERVHQAEAELAAARADTAEPLGLVAWIRRAATHGADTYRPVPVPQSGAGLPAELDSTRWTGPEEYVRAERISARAAELMGMSRKITMPPSQVAELEVYCQVRAELEVDRRLAEERGERVARLDLAAEHEEIQRRVALIMAGHQADLAASRAVPDRPLQALARQQGRA